MMKTVKILTIVTIMVMDAMSMLADSVDIKVRSIIAPILAGRIDAPAEQFMIITADTTASITDIIVDFTGSSDFTDITAVGVYVSPDSISYNPENCVGRIFTSGKSNARFKLDLQLCSDTTYAWLGVTLRDNVDLTHKIVVNCTGISVSDKIHRISHMPVSHRIGMSLHQKNENGMASCRIPGIATAHDGTLIAIYDARYDSSRDLQGDIDIVLQRSKDGGSTWLPRQTVLDMGKWGGLPERYNGVSDACILVDNITGRVFVAGLWMHGVLDDNGKWIEGLNEKSDYWVHQWKGRGSQPGMNPKETCQFLITSSDDNGLSWSRPNNITSDTKRQDWWLYAPSPGNGITLSDGTLVFPTQGRDSNGKPFSNITYSVDNGKSWIAGNPAYDDVTECGVVELSTGEIMLNMRDNRNRGSISPNGRRICTTANLGETWREHPTSRKALIEPTCMGSIHRHNFRDRDGHFRSILLFANPNHHKERKNLTLKVSFDDGQTWPQESQILFDETKGFGYSSITSVDEHTIGVLYESGLADIVFIRIDLNEISKYHDTCNK